MGERPPFLGDADFSNGMPVVDFVDLKNVWQFRHDLEARHPGRQIAIGRGAAEQVCSPGANMLAISYRSAMLQLLLHVPQQPLAPWVHGEQLDDVLFKVAATFPFEYMGEGIHQGYPIDIEAFVQRMREESAK